MLPGPREEATCFGGRATVSFPAGEVVLPHGEVGMFGGGVGVLSSRAIQSKNREVSIEVLQEPLQGYLYEAPCGEVADQGLRCVFRRRVVVRWPQLRLRCREDPARGIRQVEHISREMLGSF